MEKTFHRLTKPSARRAFVEAEVVTGIAHQIRVIRQERGWSQKELAKRLGTTQAAVSRLEDPSYGRPSIKTLLEVSRVFDVGLQVRFVSVVKMLRDSWVVARKQLEVEPFASECERVSFYSTNVEPTLIVENIVSRAKGVEFVEVPAIERPHLSRASVQMAAVNFVRTAALSVIS